MQKKVLAIGLAMLGVGGSLLSTAAVAATNWGTTASTPEQAALPNSGLDRILSGSDLEGIDGPRRSAPAPASVTVVIKPGDTLSELLEKQGVDQDQVADAVRAVGDLYNLRRLQIGDRLQLKIDRSQPRHPELVSLHLESTSHRGLTMLQDAHGNFVRPTAPKKAPDLHRVVVKVRSSLDAALSKSHVPAPVAQDVVAAARFDPGFPEIPPRGANVTVVYETPGGRNPHAEPTLRFASVQSHGEEHRVYRYELDNGSKALLTEAGKGIAEASLADPVPNAEISSGYGWRMHPILRVRKFHRGVDFAAAAGTPVHAAADGVIEDIGRRGNYGLYIRVEHSSRCATAYAHLSGFAPGLEDGSKVKRGQVIGYVGQTGLATGPHLYYEVLIDNQQTNPTLAELVSPVSLRGDTLAEFKAFVRDAGRAPVSKQASLPD